MGKYEVLEELGSGAMGVVYKARDPIINRLVALKRIKANVADSPALLERFYRAEGTLGEGCGLGLAIVREIASLHAATMAIGEGANGRGTRVSIVFAATAPTVESSGPQVAPGATPASATIG